MMPVKTGTPAAGTLVGGVVDFLVDHFQSSFFKSILDAFGALTAASLG